MQVNRLPTHTKLIILVAAPVAMLLYLSFFELTGAYRTMQDTIKMRELESISIKASNLVHELQKERGMSTGYIGSLGKKFNIEIKDQWNWTNQNLEDLQAYLETLEDKNFSENFQVLLEDVIVQVQQLAKIQTQVLNLEISFKQVLFYYTSLNAKILDLIAYSSNLSPNVEIARSINAYVSFLRLKEKAGIERAVLTNAFAKKYVDEDIYKMFIELIAQQEQYNSAFLNFAKAKQISFYTLKSKEVNFKSVEDYRKIFLANQKGRIDEVDPIIWFSAITNKINSLKDVEDKLTEDLGLLMSNLEKQSQQKLIFTVLFIFIVLTMILFLSHRIIGDVDALEKDLRETNTDLEIANDELKQFAYRTSHDLKAPLVSIESMVRLINMDLKSKKYESLKKSLDIITGKIETLKNFISDILDLNKVAHLNDVEDVDLEKEIQEAANLIMTEEIPVELILDLKHSVKSIKISSIRMRQIIQNFISNSIKYRNPKVQNPYVKITSSSDLDNLYLSVIDNGLGIAKDRQDKVFTMFSRLHSNSVEGSGLGLYLVKKHIEALDAKIGFDSAEGVGTRFDLEIPIRR